MHLLQECFFFLISNWKQTLSVGPNTVSLNWNELYLQSSTTHSIKSTNKSPSRLLTLIFQVEHVMILKLWQGFERLRAKVCRLMLLNITFPLVKWLSRAWRFTFLQIILAVRSAEKIRFSKKADYTILYKASYGNV